MNYNEAVNKIKQHKYLIGKTLNNQEITNLIIVPKNDNNKGEILARLNMNAPYEDLLIGSEDFNIIVVFDIEEFSIEGLGTMDHLEDVLKVI